MASLQTIDFDTAECLKEVQELQAFLGNNQTLKERDEILPFFRERRHLCAFVGSWGYNVNRYDRYAHEFRLWEDFVCDLIAGQWQKS